MGDIGRGQPIYAGHVLGTSKPTQIIGVRPVFRGADGDTLKLLDSLEDKRKYVRTTSIPKYKAYFVCFDQTFDQQLVY